MLVCIYVCVCFCFCVCVCVSANVYVCVCVCLLCVSKCASRFLVVLVSGELGGSGFHSGPQRPGPKHGYFNHNTVPKTNPNQPKQT